MQGSAGSPHDNSPGGMGGHSLPPAYLSAFLLPVLQHECTWRHRLPSLLMLSSPHPILSPHPQLPLPLRSGCKSGVKPASDKGLSKTTCGAGAAVFRKSTWLRHQRGLDSNPSSTTYCQPDLTSRSLRFPTLPSGQSYRNVTREALGQGLAPTSSPSVPSPPPHASQLYFQRGVL